MLSSILQYSPLRYLVGRLLDLIRFPLISTKTNSEGLAYGTLTAIDHRTARQYHIPIAHNAIQAIHLQQICAGDESDVSNKAKNGLRILDPGFQNTAVTMSRITFVDGIEGTIHYRQHSIDDLFGHFDFEAVSHLLIWGHLPTKGKKAQFRTALNDALEPPLLVIETINTMPPDAPTFSLILAGLAAYAASDPSSIPTAASKPDLYHGDMEYIDKSLVRTISSMAVIVSLVYCRQHNKTFTPPSPSGSFISNILLMMGVVEEGSGLPSQKVVDCLERLWILYLDHEMTNSTTAFLHVASTLADPISCCTAYVASGNGPLHAGAVDLAYGNLQRLGTPEGVPGLIADVKAKKYRLYGYGHRIYKTVDPRIKFIKTMLDELSEGKNDNPLLAVALEIDRIASTDEYFTSRNLKANADLYGCFVYTALGFEPDIITALMMLSRIPGTLAHWREVIGQPPRLWRPQQVFVA